MARVSSFHSSNPSDPDVHHVCSNCPPGQQIHPETGYQVQAGIAFAKCAMT